MRIGTFQWLGTNLVLDQMRVCFCFQWLWLVVLTVPFILLLNILESCGLVQVPELKPKQIYGKMMSGISMSGTSVPVSGAMGSGCARGRG
jgi:hypothetical protein